MLEPAFALLDMLPSVIGTPLQATLISSKERNYTAFALHNILVSFALLFLQGHYNAINTKYCIFFSFLLIHCLTLGMS